MKITAVTTYIVGNPWKNWVFARVDTDEGIYGVGEGTMNAGAKSVEACINELAPHIVGVDPFQVEIITQKLTRDLYYDGGQIQGCAVAAIEFACWDIIGKALGRPVYDLLGGRCHEKLRCYANGWYRGPRTPESFHKNAKAAVERGYTALKFDPFGVNWRVMTPDEEALSLDIVAAVRDAVGWDVDILIEGHNRFSVSTAIKIGERLAPYRPAWFEEPVHHLNIGSMVEVARHLEIPIATGESFTSKQQFAELLKHDAVHILQIEPLHVGGLWAARKIADMVDAFYGVIAPHSAQGPVCSAVCSHINASCPNFYIHEFFDEFNVEWEQQIISGGVRMVDGFLEISEAPGLGIDLNWEQLAKYPYAPEHWLPLFKPGWERRAGAHE